MTPEILSEEARKTLQEHILRNDGEVKDPEFKELQKYLEYNPEESEIPYLDN